MINIDERLENADWIKWRARQRAAEAAGHEFHGNQWTTGTGGKHRDAIAKIVQDAGLRFITAKKIPEEARQQLRIRWNDDGSHASETHVIEAQGVVNALKDLTGGKKLDALKAHLDGKLEVGLVGYWPREAEMSMITGLGRSILLINTNLDAAAAQRNGRPVISAAAIQAKKILDTGGSMDKAIEVEARLSALHEFGHANDALTKNDMTNKLADAVEAIQDEDLRGWLTKNISPYAASNARDASAEAFSLMTSGHKLPKELKDWVKYVRG